MLLKTTSNHPPARPPSYALLLNAVQLSTLALYPVVGRPALIHLNSLLSAALTTVLQTVFERPAAAAWSWVPRRALGDGTRDAEREFPLLTYSGDALDASSDNEDAPESCILIANHCAWADFYLVHSLAKRRGMLYACKYFCKDSLKYLPGFGWGMWLAGYLFIRRSWSEDRVSIQAVFSRLIRYRTPIWLVNYVEGTRLTPEKLRASQEYAVQRGLPVYQNVLCPRVKGFVSTVQALRRSHVRALYDLTLCYQRLPSGDSGEREGAESRVSELQQPPTMWRIHSHPLAPEYRFHVHLRRYVLEELPDTDAGLEAWILERWQEKDAYLQAMWERVARGDPWLPSDARRAP